MPGIRAFHHPATGGMAPRRAGFEFRLATASAMRPVVHLAKPLPDFLSVVTFVQTEMLRMIRLWSRSFHRQLRERGKDRLRVVAIGGSDPDRQGRAPLVGQDMPFRAGFASIRGVRSRLRPPKGAFTVALSRDWKRHLMPRNSSYRMSNFAQSFSNTPKRSHSWKRLWQVEPEPNSFGVAFHWQPVLSTYRMPSRTV